MTTLEFPLAQGWTRGLTVGFENTAESEKFDWARALHAKQVHGNKVLNLSSSSRPPGRDLAEILGEADGMMCDGEWLKENGFKLVIKTADCLPLFYIETEKKLICAIHAGWRGLQQKIHLWPFESRNFDATKTWVWVGPSLNGEKFEVRSDMWNQFEKNLVSDPNIFSAEIAGQRKFYPWNLVAQDFQKLRVELLYNVETNTYEDKQWSSYRRKTIEESTQNKKIPYTQNLSWIG